MEESRSLVFPSRQLRHLCESIGLVLVSDRNGQTLLLVYARDNNGAECVLGAYYVSAVMTKGSTLCHHRIVHIGLFVNNERQFSAGGLWHY